MADLFVKTASLETKPSMTAPRMLPVRSCDALALSEVSDIAEQVGRIFLDDLR